MEVRRLGLQMTVDVIQTSNFGTVLTVKALIKCALWYDLCTAGLQPDGSGPRTNVKLAGGDMKSQLLLRGHLRLVSVGCRHVCVGMPVTSLTEWGSSISAGVFAIECVREKCEGVRGRSGL